jgi:hypothetical protein
VDELAQAVQEVTSERRAGLRGLSYAGAEPAKAAKENAIRLEVVFASWGCARRRVMAAGLHYFVALTCLFLHRAIAVFATDPTTASR